MEEWRQVEDFPRYDVSNEGRVRNNKTGRIMKNQVKSNGYAVLTLRIDKTPHTQAVHQLVANAFIENERNGCDVNHKDGNKLNNRVDNLEFCTRRENIRHAFSTGLKKPSRQIKVRVIETNQEFESIRECARALGVLQNSICYCLNGKQRTCGGYHYELIE